MSQETKDVVQKEVQGVQGAQGAQEKPVEQKVVNLSQAVSILLDAVEIGRQKGIYIWDDLLIIHSAMKFIKDTYASSQPETSNDEQTA